MNYKHTPLAQWARNLHGMIESKGPEFALEVVAKTFRNVGHHAFVSADYNGDFSINVDADPNSQAKFDAEIDALTNAAEATA